MSGNSSIRLAVALMAFLAVASVMLVVGSGDDSDADAGTYTGGSNTSSESNPYTGVSFTCSINDIDGSVTTIWVQVGSSVNFTVTGIRTNYLHDNDASSFGLTRGGTGFQPNYTGTLSKTGTLHFYDGGPNSTADCLVFNVVDATPQYTYSINFNTNGGSGGPSNLSYGPTTEESHTFTIPTSKPTKSGYTFGGWKVSNLGASGTYQPGDQITLPYGLIPSRSLILSAIWESPVTSITLSVTPGYDSVTVTAQLNPSTTTTDSVTWTRSSGSAGSITNEGSLSATVSLNDSGTVTIKATADDASKRSATITIRVSELSFNANGGSGAPSTMLYGQSTTSSHSFTIPSSEPYWSGYDFLGWATSSTGSVRYDPGDNVSVSSSGHEELFAVWGGDASITFHANGGSGGPGSETYYDIKASGSTSVTLPSSQPSRSGWIFQGWATSSSATSASYSANGSYSLTAGDSDDLYAVWAKSTTLAYDTNGGSGNFSSSDYTIPEYGSQSVSISSTKPTHPYMDFSGWLYNGRTYQPGASLTLQPGQDVVLTAQWTAKSYTLKFDIGNGSGSFPDKTGTSSTGTCSFQLDGREPTAPSGYVFKGWATTSGGNVVYSASSSVAVSVNSNPMTLYAVYEPLPTYTLSFDANNGQNAPSSMQAQANADGEAEFQLTGAVPTRTGYTFMGWSFQSNAVSATYGASDRVTLTESDTLYAVWMPKLVTSIDITADESVLVGGSIQVTASAVPSDALQCGITFMISIGGQYATITSQQQTPTGGTATITGVDNGTITVTATAVDGSQVTASVQIDVEQRITVSYNGNGGSGVPTSHYVDTVQDSASITLSGTVPVWNGMIFKGWSEDQQAESAQYQPGQAYTFSKSTTLFAVWEPEKVLVTDITITCNLTMKVGDEITVTATGLPPEADERGVTFTITTGGDLVQIVSQSPTDDGGTMQLKAIGHGVVTITATANDGSGVYATKNVTVEQTLVLSYDLDGGQNGPSQQSHDTSSDSHVFTIGTEEPTKSGFEFMGWDSDGNGQADRYPGNTIEISHNTTLKAVHALADVLDDFGTLRIDDFAPEEGVPVTVQYNSRTFNFNFVIEVIEVE